MEILFATTNKEKITFAQDTLVKLGIKVIPVDLEMPESRSESPEEIALEKARYAYKHLGKPVFTEDSGFFIDALGGFPMTHVKFALKTLGIEKILKSMEGENDRKCRWVLSLAYVYGSDQFKSFTFYEEGEIAEQSRPVKRSMMSDWWKIYIPKLITNDKALSEMENEDLEKWMEYYRDNNHFAMFGRWFKEQNHV